ncbi:M20 family metallopeptidase [Mycolicibacterium helvum]|uniref:Probable succinyl-diaminopimelate desuccinylase n=1 Tax=Mycolicibacterium helvum TaxID=1534349 RepID=A0A7I7T7E1_9MYCO|nr:M20 family metallopeptidase [Mycolicibacterium helvum]BBY64920.1 acetylornithine deacetylase [Mycolicibacterium helvum]
MRTTVDTDRLVELVKQLIRFDSSNPPGGEDKLALYLAEVMSSLGADVEVISAGAQRDSVLAIVRGTDPTRTLAVNGHIDVVPVAGQRWTRDPFTPEVRGGKLYGRGACDMKGGIGAAIEAIRTLTDNDLLPSTNVAFHLVADEETGGKLGTRWLMEHGYLAADACLIPEPTGLHVGVAERGALFARLTVNGRGGHGSVPDSGVSAIAGAARIVDTLHLRDFGVEHPLLGRPTCNVGKIWGGAAPNVIAESCAIEVDRRILPGASCESSIRELLDAVASLHPPVDVNAEVITFVQASEIDRAHPIVAWIGETVASVRSDSVVTGSMLGSDARFYRNDLSIPTVLLGPGDIAQAHTADEWVYVDDLTDAASIYLRAFQSFH